MLKTKKSSGLKEYKVIVNNVELTIYDANLGMNPPAWIAVNSKGDQVMQSTKKSWLLEDLENNFK